MTTQMLAHPSTGSRLAARRQSVGLSRERLGAAAGGISSATIQRAEQGICQPHPSTIAALERALDEAEGASADPTNEQRPGDDRGAAKVVQGDRDADYQQ
jgi:transcriptional regulator with XRE-family HTH domain